MKIFVILFAIFVIIRGRPQDTTQAIAPQGDVTQAPPQPAQATTQAAAQPTLPFFGQSVINGASKAGGFFGNAGASIGQGLGQGAGAALGGIVGAASGLLSFPRLFF